MQIDTLLGSCVSVCLYNNKNGSGAMNHYLLARQYDNSAGDVGKFGSLAIPHILRTLMSIDPDPSHYTAQIFGGGAVVDILKGKTDIGEKNIEIAKEILAKNNIRITKSNVGGDKGRRICFDVGTNTVHCKIMGQSQEGKKLADQRQKVLSNNTRVLIIDDSATVRSLLRKVIESAPDMEVVGEAQDAYQAREMVIALNPDVLTLDIIMPKMDGLSFLQKLEKYHPKPVVIVSTIAKDGSKVAQNAIKYGAQEVVDKDSLELYKGMDIVRDTLLPKLRSAIRKAPRQMTLI